MSADLSRLCWILLGFICLRFGSLRSQSVIFNFLTPRLFVISEYIWSEAPAALCFLFSVFVVSLWLLFSSMQLIFFPKTWGRVRGAPSFKRLCEDLFNVNWCRVRGPLPSVESFISGWNFFYGGDFRPLIRASSDIVGGFLFSVSKFCAFMLALFGLMESSFSYFLINFIRAA